MDLMEGYEAILKRIDELMDAELDSSDGKELDDLVDAIVVIERILDYSPEPSPELKRLFEKYECKIVKGKRQWNIKQ